VVWYVVATGGKYGASVGTTFTGTTSDSTSLKVLMIEASDPSSTIRVNALTPEAVGNGDFGNLPQLEIGGANGGGAAPLNSGYIFEVIVYRGILSEADRTMVIKNYLGSLYGVSIAA